ncbi:bifunctional riboflavin kinase/FAD synthetase [Romboutsia lituseburensis]|uniref:Riboflavin biosynthesis protein n=1 Tax=Romboutsia lituseburensis DSM 797 TaxID=1121325 RepID=A0A1G9LCS0_9FIRM|nr:bifunctional riboflavin kinase/FAD synthetase [Romboutsia lituseburensis]CEH35262.1 Riboflavin biosynthesis protein RibF [Romboutsia lituseburensis]SDL59751.1 riboflavin kinase / FMN adenylyltransferase [Romboutsia lituseburensis DSM 797]
MNTIKSINEINNKNKSVITIGNFDGLHKGHQVLIKETVDYAKKNNIQSIVFTFENHPGNYFIPNSVKNIISEKQKLAILKNMGVDMVISIPFDDYMTKITPNEFVRNILVNKLNIEKLIIGHDFTFARNKEGNIDSLQLLSHKYKFKLQVVSPIRINGIRVSSTKIRGLILEGSLDKVRQYLGYNYQLEGRVIHSKKLGRTIGFPTANLESDNNMVIPKNGIYATKVYVEDKVYFGATNVGYNPTVNGKSLSIETNILEFDEDIYGKNIKVEFLERIRDEKKFSSLEELKNQLGKDTNYVFEKYICKTEKCMIK